MPHFIQDLEAYTGSVITKNATKIVMLTGVRTQEMRFAAWDEVELERGLWEIPAERMKMRRPHIVPLSIQVVDLFKQRKPIIGHYPYIFVGRSNRSKPISTILHEQGFDSAWIEIKLAHVDKNDIRGIYNHAQYFEKRKGMML